MRLSACPPHVWLFYSYSDFLPQSIDKYLGRPYKEQVLETDWVYEGIYSMFIPHSSVLFTCQDIGDKKSQISIVDFYQLDFETCRKMQYIQLSNFCSNYSDVK